jgi:choline-sulfatase
VNKTRQTGLLISGLILAGLLAQRSSRPTSYNCLLISFDTLRADHLGCYGYKRRPVSPNIDALARDSVVFEQHIAAAPWTTPSHMSIFTSRSPSGHGLTQSMDELRKFFKSKTPYPALSLSQKTLPEVLSVSGFSTGAFTGDVMMDPGFGFGRGFEIYDTAMEKLDASKVRRMNEWIDAHEAGPFFVFWHTYEIHAPYRDTRFLAETVPLETARAIAEDFRGGSASRPATEAASLVAHGAFNREACTALYDGAIAAADEWLGEVVRNLRASGLYDRTLIVFTSDHGEQLGERPPIPNYPGEGIHDTHGLSLFEELVHIPLIVKLPRSLLAGTRISSLSRSVDLMPTILDVLEVKRPTDLEGASLRASWSPSSKRPEALAYSESLATDYEKKSVRSLRYKYIVGIPKEVVAKRGRAYLPKRPKDQELYDLLADPEERRNLLDGASEPARLLAEHMDEELRWINLHVRSKTTLGEAPVRPEVLERLRGLGYIE